MIILIKVTLENLTHISVAALSFKNTEHFFSKNNATLLLSLIYRLCVSTTQHTVVFYCASCMDMINDINTKSHTPHTHTHSWTRKQAHTHTPISPSDTHIN